MVPGRAVGIALAVALSVLVGFLPAAEAQTSECATCHTATTSLDRFDHLLEWDESVHRLEGIDCASCHRGNASTADLTAAHLEVLSSRNPASPVHRRNLPTTCGACHEGPLQAFRESRHLDLLSAGDPRGPTCETCHRAAGDRLPSRIDLERRCESCHGPDGEIPRPGRAAQARDSLEQIIEARRRLSAATDILTGVEDPVRRLELMERAGLIEDSLGRAADGFHRFVFDTAEAEVADAHQRIDRLIQDLLSPEARLRREAGAVR